MLRRPFCPREASHGPPPVPAAILGMHTLMSNQQYYQALGSSSIVNKEGLNSEYTALTAGFGTPALLPARTPWTRRCPHASCFCGPLLLSGSLRKF